MPLKFFTTYLKEERNYSQYTVSAYRSDIHEFANYIEPVKLEDVSKREVRSYISNLVKQDLKERTINRKISALKGFYKFLVLTDTISSSPMEGVKSLKFYKEVQIPMSESEMNDLIDHQIQKNNWLEFRDYLVIQLLYYTGIRRNELIELRTKNVDLVKLEFKVLGKRNKERIIPITHDLAESIVQYKQKCKEEGMANDEYLLVTRNGKKMYPKLVYNIVNSYLSLVSDKQKKSPHILRHSFATHFLRNGAEINAVKEILGHESLAATQNYTHNDIEQLKKVFNQTHPRESQN